MGYVVKALLIRLMHWLERLSCRFEDEQDSFWADHDDRQVELLRELREAEKS